MSIKNKLYHSSIYIITIYSTVVIFLLYTCCYAYRKPFTVCLYDDRSLWGIDLKILFVFSEILGYALSKIIGTYILPSMKKQQRAYYVMGLLLFSEIAWLGFGLFPIYIKVICVFFSGLPLGLIWGIVFSFVEGRRISEVLNCGLSIATILASGLVKTLAQSLANTFQISEYWVPFATGGVVIPIMLLGCYLLNQIPEPDEIDKLKRSKRLPMNDKQKKEFFKRYLVGICLLLLFYGSLTVFRELRDSFAADIWREHNVSDPIIFTQTEYPIVFVVLALMFTTVFINSNRKALFSIYAITFVGCFLVVVSTICYLNGCLNLVRWMTLSGLGMYMGYIPFTYMIERLFASLKITATTVFIIYLADSTGYIGTVLVFAFKNFSSIDISWSTMLVNTSIISSILSMVSLIGVLFYFNNFFTNKIVETNHR